MHTETWFTWRVLATAEGEDTPRLLIPHADSMEYETPLDLLFNSRYDATIWLAEQIVDELVSKEEAASFQLVKMTLEVV